MDSRYDHHQHEPQVYETWQENQVFSADSVVSSEPSSDKKSDKKQPTTDTFTIMMPPPNANDPLHIGHAMFIAIEDILIRFNRMRGQKSLWLPGTDHAGIETQFVFEKKLKKEGKSRFNFDRQTLYQMVWDYVQENSDVAVNQMKKIGASADWDRFVFMLDPENVKIVLKTFQKLHDDNLIYRDLRLVNFCPKCGTAFSDLEINHQEQTTSLYYMKYGPFTLATTRPETKFGDTAVAVHPNDKRYQKYIGQEIEVEGLLGKFKIKVIADEYVDPEFGTGVVKITPAHDFNDFEVWQRHKDEIDGPKQVIGYDGRLNEHTGPYQGLKALIARPKIVEDLEKKGLIVKINKEYQNTTKVCYRCSTIIEPLPLPQFYIKVEPLVKPVLAKMKNGEFKVHGAGHDKVLKHWLENLKDWNISRQIVWGIRMPIWYDTSENPNIQVSFLTKDGQKESGTISDLQAARHKLSEISAGLQELSAPIDASYQVSTTQPGPEFIQETDTFDTWFSSAQWPFSTLQTLDAKNPGQKNFETFYPTQVMETGYDILPFWVMRMLMMGLYSTGELPFKDIYLHGLIRDQKGKKMSKSKGNVINPLEIIDKYGADALRMALVIRSSAGLDKSVGEPDFKAMRNLGNKIWNASRFVMMQLEENQENDQDKQKNKALDQAFENHLTELVTQTTKLLLDFKIGLAAETVFNEFWHWYCDECIEQAKKGELSLPLLKKGLTTFLKLLHPFTPFVTEAVWQELHKEDKTILAISAWPDPKTLD